MRVRDLKTKSIDEGVLDAAYNVYKTSGLGRQRAANAAEKSAQATFEKNISTLIARAIQSGSVIEKNSQPADQGSLTANNPFGIAPPSSNGPTANNPFPRNESKHYHTFNNLLEALINEAEPNTMNNQPVSAGNVASRWKFKNGAVAQTINQYIAALARKYRWQDNTELKTNAARISQEIETELSQPTVINQISQALQQKNTQKITQIIQTSTKDMTDQLFNTMYQWEQVGQDTGDSEQTKEYQNKLTALSNFLKKAAQDPAYIKSEEAEPFLQAMGILARQAKK